MNTISFIQSNIMQKTIILPALANKTIPDLVWYKLNSNILNYKDTNAPIQDAIANGSSTYTQSRISKEKCYAFTGGVRSNYLFLPSITRSMKTTFSCWLNVSVFDVGSRIFDYGDTFSLQIIDTKTLKFNNTYTVVYSSGFVNVWKHIVLTVAGTKLVFYENGIEILAIPMVDKLSSIPTKGYMAHSFGTEVNPTCKISDFRIYDRALRESEITKLYTS
jgi:Concanavalin A-like lectin/glucanases superfamily